MKKSIFVEHHPEVFRRPSGNSGTHLTKPCRVKYIITKQYEEYLRNKIAAFRIETNTRKAVHLLMLTTFGLRKNKYSNIVQKEIVSDDLF
jgi:hypothetical protein